MQIPEMCVAFTAGHVNVLEYLTLPFMIGGITGHHV